MIRFINLQNLLSVTGVLNLHPIPSMTGYIELQSLLSAKEVLILYFILSMTKTKEERRDENFIKSFFFQKILHKRVLS